VPTFRLNEQVKRNLKRFPPDFMFQLTAQETAALTSQIAISNKGRGGRRVPPYAFTEQGIAMLSSVLNSERAIQVNIEIMRAFVRMRSILAVNRELAKRIERLEKTTTLNFIEIYKFIDDYRKAKRQLSSAIGFRHQPGKK
ncbi:MAG: ORF6N domain-containing protein, partial [Blastocatellia bacterium]